MIKKIMTNRCSLTLCVFCLRRNFEGEKFRFFFIRNLLYRIYFRTFTKHIVIRNFGIGYFHTIISKPTEINCDSIQFLLPWQQNCVFPSPANGRPLHAVFLIFLESTEMCSASWYRWPFFYCCTCSFLVFSALSRRLFGIRDS